MVVSKDCWNNITRNESGAEILGDVEPVNSRCLNPCCYQPLYMCTAWIGDLNVQLIKEAQVRDGIVQTLS